MGEPVTGATLFCQRLFVILVAMTVLCGRDMQGESRRDRRPGVARRRVWRRPAQIPPLLRYFPVFRVSASGNLEDFEAHLAAGYLDFDLRTNTVAQHTFSDRRFRGNFVL